jgi:hypothetical protein
MKSLARASSSSGGGKDLRAAANARCGTRKMPAAVLSWWGIGLRLVERLAEFDRSTLVFFSFKFN